MRRVGIALTALWPLVGCGTVSMVSGQALVETSFTVEKSSLVRVCDSYNENAQSAQWVAPTAGLFDLARTFVDGEQGKVHPQNAYLDELFLLSDEPAVLLKQIVSDVEQARSGLEIVTEEAEATVWSATLVGEGLRAEMMSFETVLITAQKSRKTFLSSSHTLVGWAAPSRLGMAEFESALAAFDAAIENARNTADLLASAYAPPPAEPGRTS